MGFFEANKIDGGKKMKLSRHFKNKWLQVFGYEPDEFNVNEMIDDSIIVQRFRVIRKSDGSFYKLSKICWNHDKGIIFKIDTYNKIVITFLVSEKSGGGVYARI